MNTFAIVVVQLMSLLFLPQQETNSVVAGRVLTKDGKPVVGLTVRLFTAPDLFAVRAQGRPTDTAGRYRLENVPPGSYYVAANAGDLLTYHPGVNDFSRAAAVQVKRGEPSTVPDFSLAGLKVEGRATVDRKGPLPRIALTFTGPSGRAWATIVSAGPGGSFQAALPEGEWRVAWDSAFPLPSGYALKELRYGKQDALQQAIKIGAGDRAELNITLSAERSTWAKVEGQVKGVDTALRDYELILLSETGTDALRTDVRRNGTFEFPQVLQGGYTMHLVSVGGVPHSQPLSVGNRNVSNLIVEAPRQTELTGTARVEGGGSNALILRFRLKRGAETMLITTVASTADGTFKLALPDGEFQTTLIGIAPTAIREFRYGSTNLLESPLRVPMDPGQQLHVRLAPGVETGGLAENAPSAPRSETIVDGVRVRPPAILLQTTPQYSPEAREAKLMGAVILEVLVHEDGSAGVVRPIQKLGYGLDEEAIAAIEQWHFRPATQDGRPIAVQALIEVSFRLR